MEGLRPAVVAAAVCQYDWAAIIDYFFGTITGGAAVRLIIGITGASGAVYGIRLLEILRPISQVETHLVLSGGARRTLAVETGRKVAAVEQLADVVHGDQNLGAGIASGSFVTDGMIVAPCSMKTLSAIVNSHADNLLVRAADVVLKERRRLVLVPRESPLHEGHCRLLYQAARMGAIIAPPVPAFYNHPETIDDLVNHTAGRLLDLFAIDAGVVRRWQGMGGGES